jgi:hypothetical protein
MTAVQTGERWCSQHHGPRSQCRPADRHVQSMRASDELMAKVEAVAEAVGLQSKNDGLEMALEAWVRLPLREIAGEALASGRIRRLPRGLDTPRTVPARTVTGRKAAAGKQAPAERTEPPAPATAVFLEPAPHVEPIPGRRSKKGVKS